VCQVVWSVLLLVEMVLSYLNLAANFPVLTVDVVQRVVDLFRVRWPFSVCHFQSIGGLSVRPRNVPQVIDGPFHASFLSACAIVFVP
jgi:hypothetical protein